MEIKSGRRILRIAGAPGQTFVEKAPKWCSYLLWGVVFVRLCCPVLPRTGISLIPERLLAVGTETMYGQSANGYGNNGVLPDVDPNGQSSWQQAGNLHAGTAGNMPGAAGLANENRNVANAIDNESDANAFGTDGADGSQVAGNAVDGGCLADNRDNADGALQITGAENGSSGAAMEESVTDTNGTAVANTLYRPVGFRVIAMVWLFGMAGFMGYHAFPTCVCVTGFTDLTAVSDRWNRGSAKSTVGICPLSWDWCIR